MKSEAAEGISWPTALRDGELASHEGQGGEGVGVAGWGAGVGLEWVRCSRWERRKKVCLCRAS